MKIEIKTNKPDTTIKLSTLAYGTVVRAAGLSGGPLLVTWDDCDASKDRRLVSLRDCKTTWSGFDPDIDEIVGHLTVTE